MQGWRAHRLWAGTVGSALCSWWRQLTASRCSSRQGVSFDQANNLLIEPARIEEEEVCTLALLASLLPCLGHLLWVWGASLHLLGL